jgi:hypothetical protein
MSERYTETLNYCTRCGGELSEAETQVYAREDVTSPPICRGCIEELLEQFNDAMIPVIQEFGSACEKFIQELFGESDD